MTFSVTLSLFAALIVLAIIPGPGIMVVVARTLSQGYIAGLVTSAGIVAGDFIFIGLAVFGLSTLSHSLGELFLVIKYAGAAYLIWLGVKIALSKNEMEVSKAYKESNHPTNFVAGLLTTLSNPKAILFYVSFFPAFIDLTVVNGIDLGIILLVAAISVGGVMSTYVYLANTTGSRLKESSISKQVKYSSGAILIGSGAYVASRA